MYIASATTRTGYVARGIAGKEAASCVHSHQTAASDILFGVHFYDHVACGIASGQGGTRIRLTCHAADIDRSLHCGRGTASGDGTAYLNTHHTADIHRAADAARHRAVFNGAPAISYHAANTAAIYLIACYLTPSITTFFTVPALLSQPNRPAYSSFVVKVSPVMVWPPPSKVPLYELS